MSFNKESAVERAKKDLAKRLGIDAADIDNAAVADKDFPNMSLGSPVTGEMTAQMISSGWQITLKPTENHTNTVRTSISFACTTLRAGITS
jgi:hypothetical protein